jgi:hypothetical protein
MLRVPRTKADNSIADLTDSKIIELVEEIVEIK